MSENLLLKPFRTVEFNRKAIDQLSGLSPFLALNSKRRALQKLIGFYDPITAIHMARVGEWVGYLCSDLEIESWELAITAELHDIGKLFIPLNVLHPISPADVSAEEKTFRRKHIEYSAEILARLGFPEKVVRMARLHESPFSEISDQTDLYSEKYFLPSVLRLADVLIAAAENPIKYGNADLKEIILELMRQSHDGMIQSAVLIQPEIPMSALIFLLNEHSSRLPRIKGT